MDEEKLLSYIKGEISSETEILEILDWIDTAPENQKTYSNIKNLWVVTGLDYQEAPDVPQFTYSQGKDFNLYRSLLRYAAVFLIAFSLGSLTLYLINRSEFDKLSTRYNTIEVPFGERSRINLYDGTAVWLNSGTKLKYPVVFNRDSRDVEISGQAFFDVAKDPDHPFIVNAGQMKIKVLGTRFDISAYPDDKELTTTLVEGCIEAVNAVTGKNYRLRPGDQVVFDRTTNEVKRQEVNSVLFTSWKENLLKFEDAPFEEVIKKMERWYDIRISVDPSINIKERYTMTINTESFREVLKLVSKTTKMRYEIKERTVKIEKP